MAKLILDDVASGYKSKETINANNDAIETAVENTLSRDGTSPNQMESDLDMNSNKILNLPDGVNDAEPATMGQLRSVILSSGSGVTDHGILTGLGDDDHPQYHNDTRGDARYYTQAQIDALTIPDFSGSLPAAQGGVEIVVSLPTLPDASYPPGALVFNEADEKLYRNVSNVWTALVQSVKEGAIGVVASLPTLPDANYPQGALVFLTTDSKLYRNTDGSTWTKEIPTTDLSGTIDLDTQISGTLTAAFAEAGLINANVTINADGTLSGAGTGQVDALQVLNAAAEAGAEQTIPRLTGSVLINPSFEMGTLDSWTTLAGNFFIVTTEPVYGTYHVQATAGQNELILVNDSRLQVNEGDRIIAQAYVQKTGSGATEIRQVYVRVRWGDLSDTLISYSNGNIVTSVQYQLSRVIAEAPANAKTVRFEIYSPSHIGDNQGIQADGCYMTIVPKDIDIDSLQTTNGPAEAGADVTATRFTSSIINGDFELGTLEGWPTVPSGSTIEVTNTDPYTGTYHAQISGGATIGAYLRSANRIFCAEGDRLLASVWCKTDGTAQVVVSISYYDEAAAFLGQTVSGTAATSYTNVRVLGEAVAGTAYAQLRLVRSAAIGTVKFDSAALALVTKNTDIDALLTTNGPLEAGADVTLFHQNDLDNPEFEAGDTGWTKPDASWTIVSDGQSRSGTWAAKFTAATAGDVIYNDKELQVYPGDRVLAQANVRKDSGDGSVTVYIQWFDSAHSGLGFASLDSQTAATYTLSRVIGTAPANAVTARIGIDVDTGTSSTGYADGVYAGIFPKDADIDLSGASGQINGGTQIAAESITAAEIAALTITAAKIAASTITGSKIAANTITASNIAANTITSSEIAANTITAGEIAAGTITATELASNAVTADKITAGVVSAAKLSSTLTFTNTLTLSDSGKIHVGKTSASDTTSGIWLGTDGATGWDFHIGDSNGYLWWDDSTNTLTIVGDITANLSKTDWQDASTFSSITWTGFSGAPTETFKYSKSNDGVWARLWCDTVVDGTSNSTSMTITNLPAAIQPAGTGSQWVLGVGTGKDSLGQVLVAAKLWQASHGSAGTVEFGVFNDLDSASTTEIITPNASLTGWTNSGTKGFEENTYFQWKL